jgi:copper chaperone CopZ
MNFPKSFLALTLTAVLFSSCKDTANEPKSETDTKSASTTEKKAINPEKLETASFSIEGMTCAMGCAKTIEKELSEMEGIQKATVDFEKKTATVAFDTTLQSPESLTKTVEGAADGNTYKVSNMKTGGTQL